MSNQDSLEGRSPGHISEVARGAGARRAPGDWERVADVIQTEIILGTIYPRERLLEDAIMERLSTTRHAARRALDELQRRGFVDRAANRGAQVRSYSRKEVEDLFELQQALEAQAIRRMHLPVPGELIGRLEDIEAAQQEARSSADPLALARCNRAFHNALFGACGNDQLAQAIAGYALMIDPIRMRRNPDPEWRSQASRQHRQIIDAVRHADRDALQKLCAAHLEPAKHYYLSHLAAA